MALLLLENGDEKEYDTFPRPGIDSTRLAIFGSVIRPRDNAPVYGVRVIFKNSTEDLNNMDFSPVERRKDENEALSRLVDRVVHAYVVAGYDRARYLLKANQVPSTISARILFDEIHRRRSAHN